MIVMPEVLIKIILISTLHFLFSVMLIGAGLLVIFRDRLGVMELSPAGKILLAMSLGMVYNAFQFALAVWLYRALPVHSQHLLSIGKYAMDLLFLLFACLAYRGRFQLLLKDLLDILSCRENAALMLVSMLLGVVAVLNFPHVHDSGQLMATNHMLQSGSDFLHAGRYGLGYSALCYFPSALFKGIPMGTLVSGYKIFLLLLAGISVIYGIEKMAVAHQATGKFLLFSILIGSFFGLYGIMELGKDSAWAVLFSTVFMFSLFGRQDGRGIGRSLAYLVCAVAAGMIAIPFLFIFCAIYLLLLLLPEKISSSKLLLPAAVMLMLGCGAALMPVKMALPAEPHLQSEFGEFVHWFPADGKTSFFHYYFVYDKYGYRNSAPMAIAGLLGIFLLPWATNRYRDTAIRCTALFLPVSTLGSLFLSFLARDSLPRLHEQRIPFTPLSTKQAWDLMKDIPQWYMQLISGVMFVLVLDALIKKIPLAPKTRRAIFICIAMITAWVALSANIPKVTSLKNPAHFYRYGGNKDTNFALVMESIHQHPEAEHVYLLGGLSSLNTNFFVFDIQSYFPAKMIHIMQDSELKKMPFLFPLGPSLLAAGRPSFSKLRSLLEKHGVFSYRELEHFQKTDEGIYLITKKGAIAKRKKWRPAGPR